MIEISFGKLVVLALIALIVLGPEKLPTAARTAGALLRRMRSSWEGVRAEVERELQIEELKRTAREAAARAQAAQSELNATVGKVRDSFSVSAPAPAPASAHEPGAPQEPVAASAAVEPPPAAAEPLPRTEPPPRNEPPAAAPPATEEHSHDRA